MLAPKVTRVLYSDLWTSHLMIRSMLAAGWEWHSWSLQVSQDALRGSDNVSDECLSFIVVVLTLSASDMVESAMLG
jgi:hypothetical protein